MLDLLDQLSKCSLVLRFSQLTDLHQESRNANGHERIVSLLSQEEFMEQDLIGPPIAI